MPFLLHTNTHTHTLLKLQAIRAESRKKKRSKKKLKKSLQTLFSIVCHSQLEKDKQILKIKKIEGHCKA